MAFFSGINKWNQKIAKLNIKKQKTKLILWWLLLLLSCKDYDSHENEEKDVHCKCYCGREFITYRSLMTHRRSCFAGVVTDIKGLFTDTVEKNLNDMIESKENI